MAYDNGDQFRSGGAVEIDGYRPARRTRVFIGGAAFSDDRKQILRDKYGSNIYFGEVGIGKAELAARFEGNAILIEKVDWSSLPSMPIPRPQPAEPLPLSTVVAASALAFVAGGALALRGGSREKVSAPVQGGRD